MKRVLSVLALCAVAFSAGSAEAAFRSSSSHMNDTAAMQMRLESLGYYTGRIDGKMGPVTRGALMRFQHHNGLYASGMPTSQTLAALFDAPMAYAVPYQVQAYQQPYGYVAATPVAYAVPVQTVQTVEVARPVVWPSPSTASLPASPIGYLYTPSSYNVVTGQTASGGSIAYSYYTPVSYQRASGLNPIRY